MKRRLVPDKDKESRHTVMLTATAVLMAIIMALFGCSSGSQKEAGESTDSSEQTPETVLSEDDADGKFTIAVLPDTQQEVVSAPAIEGEHFRNRTEWLSDNAGDLDLRFVIHTGDVVNWDTPEHEQFEIASYAIEALDDADIPVALCLGNHDTAAVGPGGSAADPPNTVYRVRDTSTFNSYFSTERYPDCITFEEGKTDNACQTFYAAGKKWLVMNLELWPRAEVIEWADTMVSVYSDYNVIIATHSYLTGNGDIYTKSDYGATSPKYLFDNLISKYENIKFVFCGHTGSALTRMDVGENGNKIVTFLGAFHSNEKNPVQLIEIDTENGSVSTRFFSPIDEQEWSQYNAEIDGIEFVEPET